MMTKNALNWLEIILFERFGIEITLKELNSTVELALLPCEGKIIFDNLNPEFYKEGGVISYEDWNPEVEGWCSIMGDIIPMPGGIKTEELIVKGNRDYFIHYDILGLIYWMFTRLEEVGRSDLDEHGRFPATSSHAYKHGYLERPIVDEWLHILGQVIQKLWPEVKLKKHQFRMRVSHDVDNPSLYGFKSWKTIIRMMVGHLIKRRDIKAFFQTPYIKLTTRNKLHKKDPCNTFDWLMDLSDANDIQSAFYFICGRTDAIRDADYELEHPLIRGLMRKIHKRGHEIGLHPSYNTYQHAELIKQEANRLRRVCEEENITQELWGGRMHYLRWEQPATLLAWEQAGMSYDSTMGYADHPGFRCGTCYEYPAFDPCSSMPLQLRIRPLIVMECSVIGGAYLGLGCTDAARDKILNLKAICRNVSGQFGLLWHNSYLKTPQLKRLYKSILEG